MEYEEGDGMVIRDSLRARLQYPFVEVLPSITVHTMNQSYYQLQLLI